jgi:2-hydroxycyclohexanecarboxyl-CoA dehydrogenase
MSDSAQGPPVAFVTGGAGAIGGAIVRLLAADGHRAAVADINDDGALRVASEAGGVAVHLDITDRASVAAAVDRVEHELGPIHALVNAAGWDEFRPFVDTDEAFWDKVIELNFKGCLRVCQRIVPGMIERGGGRIVNIASDAARVGSSFEAVYAGAKGGVVAFSKTLAREVARHGVTVNVVCPGPTDTPMLSRMLAAEGVNPKLGEALRRAVPMGRIGQPQDLAGAVAFLASDRAAFITGQTVSVSGGLTMA